MDSIGYFNLPLFPLLNFSSTISLLQGKQSAYSRSLTKRTAVIRRHFTTKVGCRRLPLLSECRLSYVTTPPGMSAVVCCHSSRNVGCRRLPLLTECRLSYVATPPGMSAVVGCHSSRNVGCRRLPLLYVVSFFLSLCSSLCPSIDLLWCLFIVQLLSLPAPLICPIEFIV